MVQFDFCIFSNFCNVCRFCYFEDITFKIETVMSLANVRDG